MKCCLFKVLLLLLYIVGTRTIPLDYFHKCVDIGEAYSAAYLTTTKHLISTIVQRNYSKVSCEMASSIMLSTVKRNKLDRLSKFLANDSIPGIAVMTLDVIDFSVVIF